MIMACPMGRKMIGAVKHSYSRKLAVARRRGLTLVESALAIAIVSTLLTASLGLLGSAAKARLIQSERAHGAAMARQLMAEIVQFPYHDSDASVRTFGRETGESGGSRIDFDDVDDYDGWTASPPEDKDGSVHSSHAGWRRDVVVTTHTVADGTGFVLYPMMELKRIEVTVTDPNGKTLRMTALRSNAGSNDQLPTVTTTYLSWIGARLQIGPDVDGSIETGVGLQNQVIISQGP